MAGALREAEAPDDPHAKIWNVRQAANPSEFVDVTAENAEFAEKCLEVRETLGVLRELCGS